MTTTKPSEPDKVDAYIKHLKHPLKDVVVSLRKFILGGYSVSPETVIYMVSLFLVSLGCSNSEPGEKGLAPDRTVVASSRYPTAVDPKLVGTYSPLTKSGAGYFYDDVLEYRVWIHPKDGGDVFYRAFASYKPALQFSKSTPGAEEPLVLVRQRKWINEPETGKFEPRSDERITEWQVLWLSGNKRTEQSIERFLKDKAEANN